MGLDPLGQTQVHQLHVATAGEEAVLRLQVPGGNMGNEIPSKGRYFVVVVSNVILI